jgi:hypothetical protein
MATKQRVFSTNKTINYDDYLKLRQGTECLKTLKADDRTKNVIMNQFTNYDQFMYLSKAFYKQVNASNCKSEYVTNLYNANDSYVQHNQNGLNPPIDLCNLQVLYPYGKYTCLPPEKLYFPYKLDMNRLCRENEKHYNINAACIHKTDNNQIYTSNCNDCNSKKCKTGLCKNAKQLFI